MDAVSACLQCFLVVLHLIFFFFYNLIELTDLKHNEYLLQGLAEKPASTRVVTGSYYYTDIEEQTPCFYWLVYMANQEGRPV